MKPPTTGAEFVQYCRAGIEAAETAAAKKPLPAEEEARLMMQAGWCVGYGRGLLDTYKTSRALMNSGSEEGPKGLFDVCMPKDVAPAQVARIIIKWEEDHPQNQHEPVSVNQVIALHDVFPCSPGHTKK
jgi:hypothetical protein